MARSRSIGELAAVSRLSAVKEADGGTRKKVAGEDKQIGKDDKGRTIYEGPRGGQYYINSNGNKTYLKADKKL